MRRNTTILLVGALLAALALGAVVPTAGAQQGTDVQTTTPDDEANTTEVRAQYMAQWMETRMGPEGVAAFEEETGTNIETVAQAMAEHMGPWADRWTAPAENERYGPGGYGPGEYAPGGNGPGGYGPGSYGPGMPCGGAYGQGMGGYGPGMGGYGPGMGR